MKKASAETKKNRFANAVVAVCLAVTAFVTAAVIYEYHRLDSVIPASVLGTLFGFWGGELLTVAVRQIFGSDLPAKLAKSPDGERI